MYTIITKLKNNQVKFFIWYYIIVISLVVWSYIEGVGDIQGDILISGEKHSFKAGYFTSFNYGIYYVFVLPFFIRAMFATYFTAEKLSNLQNFGTEENDILVKEAIENYSSKIVNILKKKWSKFLFLGLFSFFIYQNIIVEINDYKKLSLGWVQGQELKKAFSSPKDTIWLKKKFYFRDNLDLNDKFPVYDSVKITNISFASKRKPDNTEFILFVIFAKLFFALFTTSVFFYNFNLLFSLYSFFKEKNKELLFKSEKYVKATEELVSHISLSGLFLTIFLYFRYIANSQKGSFKSFNWGSFFSNDQYLFLFGMLFIPITSAVLFTYVYISDKKIDIKGFSFRKLIDFYLPNFLFIFIFLIYILTFDPKLSSQFKFIANFLKAVNEFLVG